LQRGPPRVTTKGNPIMSTVYPSTVPCGELPSLDADHSAKGTRSLIDDLRARLLALDTEAQRLTQERQAAFVAAESALRDAGHECYIVPRRKTIDHAAKKACDTVHITILYGPGGHAIMIDFPHGVDAAGPRHVGGNVYDARGDFAVIAEDEDHMLVARRVSLSDVTHRRTIGRLRAFARPASLRVQLKGQEVTLIDPVDTEVWTGNVTSAFLWLAGLDPSKRAGTRAVSNSADFEAVAAA